MTHAEFSSRIDAYDALPADERRALDQHARECVDCAQGLAGVTAILAAARALPRQLEPGHDLWPELETRLRSRGATRKRWAIAAAVAVVCATSVWYATAGRPGRSGAAGGGLERGDDFPALVSGLARECMGAGKSLDASLQRQGETAAAAAAAASAQDVSAALVILDRSIDETRAALARVPGDPALERMLTARYQQKLALLHATLLRAEAV